MKFCGIKTTHDGAVSLIDEGKLVFSYEMEKLNNNSRYKKIDDLAIVFALLDQHGYTPESIDHYVIDGWYKTHKIRQWYQQEVEIVLAPYRRGLINGELFQQYQSHIFDLPYLSYSHYATHVAASFCTSPFAERAEDCYVLSWDAHMFPYLYYFAAGETQPVDLGPLFLMIGDTYTLLSNLFTPFDVPLEYPQVLGISGKVMAYIATGQVCEKALAQLDAIYTTASTQALAVYGQRHDRYLQWDLGYDILERMKKLLNVYGISDADMLASLHVFLENKLITGLQEKLAASTDHCSNLCMTGGTALNIKWNRAVRESLLFKQVWVPPFPNDAGSAIGAACCGMLNKTNQCYLQWDVYSGPELNAVDILDGWHSCPCDIEQLAHRLFEKNEPVVFLNGCAELGPRSLGNRSILASASSEEMKNTLNRIKDREWYRPIAPICLEHRADEVFTPGTADPYMLFDHDVKPLWQKKIPAVCHLDGTSRLQTVNLQQNPDIYHLLLAYEKLSGIPLLCNTSANHKHKGFFPDVGSAMRWGQIPTIWSEGVLYCKNTY